jgi:hypothetical protein
MWLKANEKQDHLREEEIECSMEAWKCRMNNRNNKGNLYKRFKPVTPRLPARLRKLLFFNK